MSEIFSVSIHSLSPVYIGQYLQQWYFIPVGLIHTSYTVELATHTRRPTAGDMSNLFNDIEYEITAVIINLLRLTVTMFQMKDLEAKEAYQRERKRIGQKLRRQKEKRRNSTAIFFFHDPEKMTIENNRKTQRSKSIAGGEVNLSKMQSAPNTHEDYYKSQEISLAMTSTMSAPKAR